MKVKVSKWDLAEVTHTKEDVIAFLEVLLEENDTGLFLSMLKDIARSKGMTDLAKELGVTREGLYKSLSARGNPSFSTVVKALNSLGFTINITLKKAS